MRHEEPTFADSSRVTNLEKNECISRCCCRDVAGRGEFNIKCCPVSLRKQSLGQ